MRQRQNPVGIRLCMCAAHLATTPHLGTKARFSSPRLAVEREGEMRAAKAPPPPPPPYSCIIVVLRIGSAASPRVLSAKRWTSFLRSALGPSGGLHGSQMPVCIGSLGNASCWRCEGSGRNRPKEVLGPRRCWGCHQRKEKTLYTHPRTMSFVLRSSRFHTLQAT